MSICLVTGSGGLIGSESVRFFADKGFDVVGIDNDMRRYFFGDVASTAWNVERLKKECPTYSHQDCDIRCLASLETLFARYNSAIEVVIHTAAQPSHDWAAREPFTDFGINANGTLNLLEMTRKHCPASAFIFTSTNKVYGDRPNSLPLVEQDTRWELDENHAFYDRGIDESMSIDGTTHSLFGASKVAADILVQEYGRYFGINTVCFRGGCLTGPCHSGAPLHGFLAYLLACGIHGRPYTVLGYKGKQVRDNIHSFDLVNMFWHYTQRPRPGAVYNAGGSRHSNCSILEAVALCEQLTGKPMAVTYSDDNRIGDHIWWISDVSRFRQDYPDWSYTYDLKRIVEEILAYGQD